LKANHNVLMVW